MGALLQTRNTSQSLTTFSFTPSDIVSAFFPARASSAPTISQPESAQLSYAICDSLPELPKHAAISMYENLVLADDKQIATASSSRVPSDKTNSYLADVSSAYEQSAVMTDAVMDKVKIRGAKMSDAQLPKDITLNLPDDYFNNRVPDSGYFKQVTEAAYSLGKLDKKTRQNLYNLLWTRVQEPGNEEFYEAHRSVLIDAQVKDTDPSPGGDGKGSIYQMIWETVRP